MFRDTVLDVCSHDPEMALRVFADDAAALGELLDLACSRTGVDRELYEAELLADALLFDLQRLSLREIVEEPPDPGPYAQNLARVAGGDAGQLPPRALASLSSGPNASTPSRGYPRCACSQARWVAKSSASAVRVSGRAARSRRQCASSARNTASSGTP